MLAVCFRLNEIRVLKVRLADMRRELHVLRTGVANVDVLKREVRGLLVGRDDCMGCITLRRRAARHGTCLNMQTVGVAA
jgi:hypothetical protein